MIKHSNYTALIILVVSVVFFQHLPTYLIYCLLLLELKALQDICYSEGVMEVRDFSLGNVHARDSPEPTTRRQVALERGKAAKASHHVQAKRKAPGAGFPGGGRAAG